MSGLGLLYLVACGAALLCGIAAWVLITTVNHFDSPDVRASEQGHHH